MNPGRADTALESTTLSPSEALAAATSAPRNRQTSEFTTLMQTVQETGLMRRRYAYYWARFAAVTASLVLWVVAFIAIGESWWQLGMAALLAVLLGQVMFLGHDAAHRQIFASVKWNDWASLLLANLYAGMSYGWWLDKHSRHHAKPNQVGADGDIGAGALVFTTENLDKPRTGIVGWFTKNQGYAFFPLLLLEGINLHREGLVTILGRGPVKRRGVEITLVLARLGGFLALVFWVLPVGMAFAFLGVQLGLFGLYMGASFAPNHKGMPIVPANAKVDFLRRQVLTSRNISGGRPTTFFMGGLNYQVEHHLFPTMASPNLRRVQPIVKEFCASRNIPYTETTLMESYGIVVRYLNEVGLQARDPFQCPISQQYRVAR